MTGARRSSVHSVTSTLTSETSSAAASASIPTHRSYASMSLVHGSSDYRVPFIVGRTKKETDDDTMVRDAYRLRSDSITLKSNGVMLPDTAKRSPIGRYAEENNYKIANIVSSGNSLSKSYHGGSVHSRSRKFGRSVENESSGIIDQTAEVESKVNSPVDDHPVISNDVGEPTNHSKEEATTSTSVAMNVAPFKTKVSSNDSRVNSLECLEEKSDLELKGSILRR